jgi:hypothetical protein
MFWSLAILLKEKIVRNLVFMFLFCFVFLVFSIFSLVYHFLIVINIFSLLLGLITDEGIFERLEFGDGLSLDWMPPIITLSPLTCIGCCGNIHPSSLTNAFPVGAYLGELAST